MEEHRTIAGIATPPGDGGVGIIRISGPEAIAIGSKVFSKPLEFLQSRVCHFGKIVSSTQETLDEVLLLIMRAPHSFTGEDVVEIQCHGGHLIVRRVLARILEAGALQATAGEFSFKAFMNGKIDLAQAEAIQAMIGAKNGKALDAAMRHLEGGLSKQILSYKQELIDAAAVLEAWVDFPDEGLEFASFDEIVSTLQTIDGKIDQLLSTYHDGKIASEGLHIALVGSPNVGKSSLMNALLKKERAIVSPIAGTTRDLIEDHLMLSGLHVRLTDTAGIRSSTDQIEEEGIRRSKKALEEADLILFLLDASLGLTRQDLDIFPLIPPHKTLVVWNKIDLKEEVCPLSMQTVKASALKSIGIDDLKRAIDQMIWQKGPPSKEEILITNMRHHEALSHASLYVKKAYSGLQTSISPEFITFDVRQALHHLGKIVGSDIQEDILSSIFSKFCVGK